MSETIGNYDLNGNIKELTLTANGSTSDNFTYTYSGNRLTSLSGITGTYTYSDNGNLTNASQHTHYNSLTPHPVIEYKPPVKTSFPI